MPGLDRVGLHRHHSGQQQAEGSHRELLDEGEQVLGLLRVVLVAEPQVVAVGAVGLVDGHAVVAAVREPLHDLAATCDDPGRGRG
jgi:hypothetical protein